MIPYEVIAPSSHDYIHDILNASNNSWFPLPTICDNRGGDGGHTETNSAIDSHVGIDA